MRVDHVTLQIRIPGGVPQTVEELDTLNVPREPRRSEATTMSDDHDPIAELERLDRFFDGEEEGERPIDVLRTKGIPIPDEATLIRELQAYETHRNAAQAKITWRFTSEQARVKLQRLYPTIPQN